MTSAPAQPVAAVDVLLADGTIATIRRVVPSDHEGLLALHDHLAEENLRMRFFGLNRAAGHDYAEHLAAAVGSTEVLALVALVGGDLVAVASAEVMAEGTAEISFLVADSAHGLGLGTLLLEHLAAEARGRGILEFTADVLVDNHAMLRVLADCGFDLQRRTDTGVVTFHMGTAATERAVAAADAREAGAEARSLAPLLYPRSIAVVGVRRSGGGVGRAVLEEVADGGFTGEVYVVHPGGSGALPEVSGARVVPDLAAIGSPVDLVVVAVPAGRVLDVVRDAAHAGARSAVILTSGFGEAGSDGAQAQRELVAIARRHSMRLVGPNCLGVMTTDADVRLNATFTRGLPQPGGLAVASQSGGVGIGLLDLARESGAGLASFVSLGNKADVSGNDLLAAWMDDPRVSAAALYLESFGNARKFARIARRFAQRKPLLAVVGGRSTGGRRAGASHTAAAAAPTVGVDALFAQSGVIGCSSLEELADAARLLTSQPLPSGPRLAIVGNAGGLGVLAADSATAGALVVPELSPVLQESLTARMPGAAGLSNPIDLGAAASADGLLATTETVLASDEVDAVLVIVAATKVTDADGFLRALADARSGLVDKPLLLVALGGAAVPEDSSRAFAAFRSVEDATRALAHAASYAAWLDTPAVPAVVRTPGAGDRARPVVDAALAEAGTDGWLRPAQCRELLSAYGIDVLGGRVERRLSRILTAAHEIGYPVVLKAADPAVVHKTERGLVRPGLKAPDEVLEAAADLELKLGVPEPELLVQAQVPAGVEVAVGVVRDDGFGPLVMVAAGGVATDVWDDRVFLLPPLTAVDAARAVRRLRIWPLLAGHRGAKPVDVAALEALLQAVGQLAVEVPELAEMDLNPVIMSEAGAACVDVKVRLSPPARPADDGVPRKLRPAP
ncbi:acyl-CoA synthetase (NDP forming)/GNAT superfamily N-acetyltransferase [Nocardioides ginsengisegetis]|uniref:Acyl-CoA synthetase (NDP forming)/GNAT superfamily N-acetyltransferase n=1 Tax=Nocardioides ginsengisegetis TaxID=661491 RepID=A0A7W3IZA1_9ACTN|nr:acetate--CoA ligase [Nocardioides ginsengisegetis]MBA8803440.1 acyl-CoA synthetase (NDP forming)/GNAT superfamily N-acetyltransferase [Nocardioides ginsengisegetis]